MIKMGETQLLEGLKSGLLGVKGGEHCQILFSGKYGFGNEQFGIIPVNSALLYEIWVEAVSND
jgi:FKBP-type peptidyl-prolyl cis-trans isomerase